jgi:hypothetical protein
MVWVLLGVVLVLVGWLSVMSLDNCVEPYNVEGTGQNRTDVVLVNMST